jgi:D-lactate dehydrogenase
MGTRKPIVGVFDSKPYDRDYLARAVGSNKLDWHFHDFRLETETAVPAKGVLGGVRVCQRCCESRSRRRPSRLGRRLSCVALCGIQQCGSDCCQGTGLIVTRVPSYSPHAVGRGCHRAHSRVEP